MPELDAIAPDPAARSRASVASWLGLLLAMLLSLNTLGGWVRLSGSGIAIPQWPLINGSLLPPSDDAGWAGVRADWERHQAKLRERVAAGELSAGNLGRAPQTDADFKRMFLTEYGHRLLAALAGLVFAGCLTVVLRDRTLRRRVGVPMSVAGALVLFQAGLGGFLVDQGTNTHWLFLHQGNAACILACVLWSLLRLLQDGRTPSQPAARPALRRVLGACVFAAWGQLLLGALVAGSKFSAPFIDEFPTMLGGRYLPPLWEGARPLAWNLLDNAWLHQWAHRWFAWVLVLLLACSFALAARSTLGPRLRLALQVSATFVAVQIVLGITSVLVAGSLHGAALPLAHQLMGMCLFCAIVLAWYDARHEPERSLAPSPRGLSTAEGVA
jgi:cytochrome c oxidase assembly protein subunit 15